MEYLLLWSGDVRGMKKARIPSEPCRGYLFSVDETGAHVVPSRDAIRAALPQRLRAAFDRSQQSQLRGAEPMRRQKQPPLTFALCRADHSWITTLYLQPLDTSQKEFAPVDRRGISAIEARQRAYHNR